jgi:hypothetical protein
MNNELLTEILAELRAIRAALQVKPFTAAQPAASTSRATPGDLPPPAIEIADAGSVQIHFGKNTGTPLSSLSDKQLLWYGADRPPQLKKDGTPFAPREADVQLTNACRTLWKLRKSGAVYPKSMELTVADDGENVPF